MLNNENIFPSQFSSMRKISVDLGIAEHFPVVTLS